jgi:hypothetical protein
MRYAAIFQRYTRKSAVSLRYLSLYGINTGLVRQLPSAHITTFSTSPAYYIQKDSINNKMRIEPVLFFLQSKEPVA